MPYFSQLKGRPVYDKNKAMVGTVKDLVFLDGEEYGKITHLVYLSEEKYRKKIPWTLVWELKERRVKGRILIDVFLNSVIDDISPFFEKKKDMHVASVMDKQIVDVNGVKVVRVNDIMLRKINSDFGITGVCVGTKSLLRRSGLSFLSNLIPGGAKEKIIPWESVEPLEKNLHDIHVKVQRNKISDLHPEDIADIMEDLDHNERAIIFESLDEPTQARTIIEAEPSVQGVFIRNMRIKSIVSLLENIPAHQAADIISLMPRTKQKDILKLMDEEDSLLIKEILKYPDESAGAIMHTDFITVPVNFTAQKTISMLRKLKPQRDYRLYIIDRKKHLLGVLSVRALVTAQPKTVVSEIMQKHVIKIRTGTPKEDIANIVAKYDLLTIPVVDEENVLKGVVSADEVLTNVMPKAWRRRRVHVAHKNHGHPDPKH